MTSPMIKLLDDPQRSRLFKQGAEAKVYVSHLFPAPLITRLAEEPVFSASTAAQSITKEPPTLGLLKYRFPKTYRHQTLSSHLTATRTTAEARALVRCSKAGVHTPAILCVDEVHGILGLEVIDGKSVRELLGGGSEGDTVDDSEKGQQEIIVQEAVVEGEEALHLMSLIGVQLAKMHQAHVIHGDLTTSNMMIRTAKNGTPQVVLIDFGLSSNSTWPEDKAVDLYVLERAFQSTHPSSEHLFDEILHAYQAALNASTSSNAERKTQRREMRAEKGTLPGPTIWVDIQRKLEDVRQRGRKRSMVG